MFHKLKMYLFSLKPLETRWRF